MTPYENAVARLVHPHLDIINWYHKTSLTKELTILKVGKSLATGDARYYVDVQTGEVVVRIYYHNDSHMAGVLPTHEAYYLNNGDTTSLYIVNSPYLPSHMYPTIMALVGHITSNGGTYEVFPNGDMVTIAITGPLENFLSDHLANAFTDESGNFIIVNF